MMNFMILTRAVAIGKAGPRIKVVGTSRRTSRCASATRNGRIVVVQVEKVVSLNDNKHDESNCLAQW